MYKRMLVPLDGSELAEVAIDYAREAARRLNLEVIVLHVCRSDQTESINMCRAYLDRVTELLQCKADVLPTLPVSGPECRPIQAGSALRQGFPAEEILRYTDENKVDVILMATHGHSGIRRWALGSTADKIVRVSQVPVWLIRACMSIERLRESVTGKTILVPLDGSELSESVLPHARELVVKGRYGELVLLRVCEPATTLSPARTLVDHHKKQMERDRRSCGKYLDKVSRRLINDGIPVRTEVLLGLPEEEISEYEKETRPAVTAMATHGRSGIGRWAFGSVAERVLMGGTGPILLIRPQQGQRP